jgi:rhodanese-related sulfurtransferase
MSHSLPLEIDCHTVQQMRVDGTDDHLLLDCREPAEISIASIDGAMQIPLNKVPTRLAELESYRDHRAIIYCHHGVRSLQLAQWLRQQGFSRAQSMAGGIDAWAINIEKEMPRY